MTLTFKSLEKNINILVFFFYLIGMVWSKYLKAETVRKTMEAPSTFHPSNVLKTNRGFPPPIRLGYTKTELLGDASNLKSVDEHAIKVTFMQSVSLKGIMVEWQTSHLEVSLFLE